MSVRFNPEAISAEAPTRLSVTTLPRLPPVHVLRPRLTDALLEAGQRIFQRQLAAFQAFDQLLQLGEGLFEIEGDFLAGHGETYCLRLL